MRGLSTPRSVLAEIKKGKNMPAKIRRVFGEVEQTLIAMGVIDQWMSELSIEALLEEAVDRATRPLTEAELRTKFAAMDVAGRA